jgi:sugar/nucleoside kinase (ribokinase family)
VRRGTVAGAIVASRLACSEAMPREEELEAALV